MAKVTAEHDEIIDPFDNEEVIAKQTAMALKMRRQGHDYLEISQALTRLSDRSVSVGLARKRVQGYWKRIEQEACVEQRQLEIERLDDLLRRYYRIIRRWADDPDTVVKVGAQILKVSESRRKLLGLDAPQRVDATVTETTQADLELQDMVNEQRARNARKAEELTKKVRRSE